MIESTYDMCIMLSILFLTSVYFTTLSIVVYTGITKALFKCQNWILIPKFIINYLSGLGTYDKTPGEVWLLCIIFALAIIPFSLVWIISYPACIYFIVKHRNKIVIA